MAPGSFLARSASARMLCLYSAENLPRFGLATTSDWDGRWLPARWRLCLPLHYIRPRCARPLLFRGRQSRRNNSIRFAVLQAEFLLASLLIEDTGSVSAILARRGKGRNS